MAAVNVVAAAAAAAELAAQHHQAEVKANSLSVEFAADIAARPPSAPITNFWENRSLRKEAMKFLNTPAGQDVLHQATQQEPIDTLLPQTLQYDLMTSDETMELRTSAQDLRALLSQSSRALSVVVPLRNKRTVAEYEQELEEIYQIAMGTCKQNLKAIYLRSTDREELEFTKEHHVPVLRKFLHHLLNSLEDVMVLSVFALDTIITDDTLAILAARHKNLKDLGVVSNSEVSSAGLRTLTSGCKSLEFLSIYTLSPEAVVSTLQDLPALKYLYAGTNQLEGMLRYAMDHTNPPHQLECEFALWPEQEQLWGGENYEHLLTTYPNQEMLNICPITERYSDTMASRLDDLKGVSFEVVGAGEWPLLAQAHFFSKFTTLTRIFLSSLNSLSWDVDLGVIGVNCLGVKFLRVYGNFTFRDIDTNCFKQLRCLNLTAPLNRQVHPPDSFLKILLSGPHLFFVNFTSVDVPDQVLLDLSQSAAEQRGGVFARLRSLILHRLSQPGLQAATVIRVACQALELRKLRFSMRKEDGSEEPILDHLVLCKFFEASMSSVAYTALGEP